MICNQGFADHLEILVSLTELVSVIMLVQTNIPLCRKLYSPTFQKTEHSGAFIIYLNDPDSFKLKMGLSG